MTLSSQLDVLLCAMCYVLCAGLTQADVETQRREPFLIKMAQSC